ncbi:MAG: uroporphyrinogen-III synthase, partial [Acidimicrobiales bacterium]
HRGLSASFSVVTGHSRQSVDQEVNWETLAKLGGTIVVLMGVAHRDEIAERLMAGGLDPATPVLAVVWGTRPDQSSVRTTLAGLSKVALAPPATIVIGRVAGLALSWYERKPLLGWRVVVTRAREQASSLADLLRNAGAEPVEFPVIEVRDAADGGLAMAEAADRLQTYDWVVFTSANAVDRFMRHVPDARAFGRTRIAVVGPGTASVLAAHKLVADIVPERFVAEGLLEAFPPPDGGKRVLMPRASKAREVLPTGLRSRGWEVHDVEAYRTEPARPSADLMISLARADAITFTSASTVAGFVAAARPKTLPPVVVCIGPLTAKAAGDYGLKVDAVAKEHTIDGVVAALAGVASGMSPSRGTSADP